MARSDLIIIDEHRKAFFSSMKLCVVNSCGVRVVSDSPFNPSNL